MGIAELNRCITCHIAAEFLFVNCAVYVLADVFLVVLVDETGSCAGFVMLIEAVEKVVFGNIESDELNILVLFLVLNLIKRSRKSKAGHNDDVVTAVDGFFNFCNALFGGVACGFEVLEVNFVCITVFLAGFIGGLVERLVGDVAVVGDHCDFVVALLRSAPVACGKHGNEHQCCKNDCKQFLHGIYPPCGKFDYIRAVRQKFRR